MPPAGSNRGVAVRRPRLGLWVLLGFVALSLVGQAVPLYTDWLWFQEVGFTKVFTTRLTVSGWLFLGLGAAVFVFLFANLSVAARTAPPDVLWELEDQLGLPGRAILEPLVRRLLLPVIAVIAFFAGARATGSWATVLEYLNATPFGQVDPLFGRDLGFYFFVLPSVISSLRPLDAGGAGIVISSTPSRNVAFACSAIAPSGNGTTR